MKQSLLRWGIAACIFLFSYAGFAQVKNNFDVRYENRLKGDLTFIANNIVNRDSGSTDPEDPYNLTGNSSEYNDRLNMQYIDIDGDPSTFSSSSATLAVPDPGCSLIRYAGLYWSAVYKGSNRSDFNQVKFRVPGGSYVDLTADEILFDGYNDADFGSYSPYACYKDVTSIVSALANPDGEYFVANVRASSGSSITGGISGGWTLIVVYENPTLPGKYITTFDGYAGIKSGQTVDIPFSGFTTLPAPFPVNAKLGVAALEGDNRIPGDQLALKADSNGSFTTLSNTANPSTNFFNSNITNEGSIVTTRNPNSVNTLGWDVDLFTIPNPNQTVIPNDETGATLRASSTQDKYDIFFTSLDVEIIEPLMNLAKTVEDIGGNDITGQGVHLGQYLDYVLTFENVGNDDAVNYTIRDVLPINVTLDEASINMPAGVTYTYDPATRTIIFTIPDSIVEEGDPAATIRMRVQVAENCFDFIDACTDIIQNLAYSTYQGAINTAQITDDPSVSDFDGCGFGTPGATNFLLDDLSACNFSRTVQLCGDDVLLDAGNNFDNYIWYRDENGNNQIDVGTDTVITDADSDNDPSTMLVSEVGTYLVDKQVADPCKDFMEIIVVELFGSVQSNPITALINDTSNTIDGDVIVCPNDGSETPEIFLCGLNDTELIQVNIPDALSIVWEQLDEASCAAVTDGCANTNSGCTWNTVDTGNDFTASDSGQYRLVINYQNGCFSRFYFNIYKNPLDPQYTSSDIICNTPGNITVTNMPLSYEFQLVNQATGTVLVPYQSSPSFDIATNGAYMVEMRQQGVTDGCVFVLDNIGILERDFQVEVTSKDTDCTGLGEIAISVLNVEPQYYYEVSLGGTVVDTYGPSTDNNYTFENLNDGVYDISVSTDDGCAYTQQVTINDLTDLELTARVSQHITCKEGNILMESSGGKTPHTYAIWSYVDDGGNTVISYPSVTDIPASAFQTSQIFDIYDPGQYTFVVVDRNNCYDISNTVTIEFRPAADFNATSVIDVSCYGESTGAITFNLVSSNGYQLTYYLFDATGFDEDNFDINNALATNASGNFPGLASGDYVVVINQRKGSADCDYFEYHTISAPTNALDADAALVQGYTCLQDGIIEAQNVTGGTAPYEYSIDGVTFGASPTFPNLTDGTYSITVRDDNGCTFVTNSVTIDPLDPPTDIDFSATNPLCPTFLSDVTLSVTGGTPNLVYEIIAPAGSVVNNGNNDTFPGLTPGTYMFRVTDANGCFYDESYTINPVTEISVTGQLVSNITCFGDTDGEIQYTVANFNTDYDYTVTGPANFSGSAQTNGTISLTGLAEGTYTIIVTDNFTNCTDTADVTIAAPPSAISAPVTITQPTCLADGSVNIVASGGWGSYTYEITAGPATYVLPAPQSNGLFSNLTIGGTYTFTITDANGCVFTDTFDIIEAVAPVLDIVPNDICYDDAVGLTLTANVTSGGDGNFEYSLNGGPFGASNVFTGLGPGSYTIDVRDGNDCIDSASITINPELSVVASAPNITACTTDTDVTITAAGGDGNYVYAVVANGVSPTPGDFSTTNPITVTGGAGDYDVYVRDNGGAMDYCEAAYDITIVQDEPLAISISNTDILCSGESQAQIIITASDGEGPYLYSIDNGVTYQASNTFVNQPAGSYNIRVRDANNCEVTEIYTITEPLTLSASAAVTALAECYPGMGAEVRITNAIGGTAPYEYSFDGGSNYGASSIGYLLPGTHTLYIRDANLCTYPMTVTIDPEPTPPTATTSIDYECDGEGTITVTPSSTDFDYTYKIDGNPNTPDTSNIFTDVAVGSHTITVNYTSNIAPTPSVLLLETFGTGPNTSIPEVDPAYCYEPQNGSLNSCGWTPIDTHIQDGEYSVTQNIVNPYGTWLSPNDHSGMANGRFLAMNVGGAVGPNGIIYAKRNIEVVANRDITISLWAFNLLRTGTSGADPDIDIQLVDGVGTVIASTTTGNVPKNNGVNDWQNYTVTLNPGANTNLDIVIRTNSAVTGGNDIAIDDIEAFQTPEVCTDSITINVNVEDGHAFDAAITAFTNLTCNGAADGSITFEAENFEPATGFTYQVDGGAVSAPQFAGPITVNGLTAGNHTITIVDLRDPACSVVLNQTLTEPAVLDVTAAITTELTCTNGGAVITATATGGTPVYQYQLEDDLGNVLTAYQASNVFSGLAAGDYVVRARDTNLCEDVTTVMTVVAPTPIVFTSTPTACYSGNNDGSIQVDVTDGNGNYQFSLNGGTWMTPTPVSGTTYTFGNLTAGTYTIDVRDQYGCTVTDTATINSALTASAFLDSDLTCPDDAQITINASGGSGTYSYEWSNDGGATYNSTGFTGNVFTTNTDGTYMFQVTDATGCTTTTNSIIVTPADQPVISNVIPTDILCSGESTGTLDVVIDTSVGVPPYTINVVETSGPINYGSQTTGLPAGSYEVTITDDKGCVSDPFPVIISEPTPIVPNVTHTNLTCVASSTELGTITVDASGGTPDYIYQVYNNDFSVNLTYDTSTGTNDHTFTGLDFGDYTIQITDANGCQNISTVTITTGPDILITTVGASGCTPGSGEMTVEAQASNGTLGIGTFYFAIYPAPAFNAADPAWFPEDPLPAADNTHLFTGLTPGVTYTFIVFDTDTNCEYIQEATVPVATNSTLISTIDASTNITCTGAADGTVDFTISGYGGNNVNYEIFYTNTHTTTGITGTISGAVGGPESDTASGLSPGEYYILYEEADGPNSGCVIASDEFLIEQAPTLLQVTANSPINDNCNPNAGVINASAQYGMAPYEYLYLPASDPAPTASTGGWTSNTTANVDAGNYIVYAKDANDCIQSDPVTVLEDPSPEISISIVDECVDEGLFEVMVTLDNPADAMAPFQISVNGAAFQNFTFDGSNQYLISGLSSGLGHTIEVRDLNGCIDIETFDIYPPLEFNVIQTVALDCELGTAAYAELEIEVISGAGPYNYEIIAPIASFNDSGSLVLDANNKFVWTGAGVAGNYEVIVYDMGTAPPECYKTITIDVPIAPYPSITSTYTDVTCSGDDDGTITVTAVDNGIGPYTFEIIGASDGSISVPIAPTSTTPTTATFTGLEGSAAGITYDIQVTAANNCPEYDSQTITEPDPIDNIDVDVVEFACAVGNNDNNASITVDTSSITGGSGNYVTYEFINDAGSVVVQSGSNPTYIETDINGGNYTINVYDDNGCLGTTTAVIAPYDQITNAVAAVTNPLSCSPGLDGEITITVTSTLGDPSRFEYSIDNGSNWQNSNVFGNLDVGTHNFLVRHLDTGCMVSTSETITNPNTFNIDVNVVGNVICYGTATGEVTFELLDATYTGGFNWTIYDTNGTPVNTADDIPVTNGTSATTGPTAPISLPAGSYTVEISQDAFPECTNVEAFNIAGPNAAITGSAIVTDITCVDDGTIEVITSGGWGGYTYYVGVGAPGSYVSNPIFSGLTADTYEVWVRDSSGCEEHIDTITLDDPDPISALFQINQSNCVDLQGEIEVVGTIGGQGSNYMYQLIKDGTNFGSPQTNTIFSGLGAGSYTVEITDQWGCSITLPATLELYNAMTANATVDKTIDCTMNPGGQITINVTGGSSNLQYSVEDPLGNVTIDADADGVFTGLTEPGEYIFTIIDLDTSEPCTYEVRQTLDDKVDPILLDATIVDVSCAGGSDGSILANLDPATAGNPPYRYELIGISLGAPSRPLQDSPLFENLPAGNYEIRVVSSRECEYTKPETISEPSILAASAMATDFACTASNSVDESTITVTPSGGTPFAGPDPYLYSFEGNSFTTDATFDVVDDGTVQTINYIVRDANGCEYRDSIDVQPLNSFTLDANQDIAISCINPETVTLTVTESIGGDTYTFELLPVGNPYGSMTASTATTATFELTEPGSYTFRATNEVTGCYVEEIYTIDPFDTIDVDATATAPAMCFDDAGTLEIDVTGYTGTYDYEVFNADGTTTGITGSGNTSTNPMSITDPLLVGGNYFVRVSETGYPECIEDSNTITIVSPSSALDYTPQEVANVTCTNDQGEILIAPTGGYASYDIVLTNTTTAQVYTMNDVASYLFTGLSAGVYTVRVTDNGGCFEDRTITLTEPLPITADIDAAPIDLLCYGDESASVWAHNVSGGEGTYVYQLNIYDATGTTVEFTTGEQANNTFTGLGAGIYSITVSDGWNCGIETPQVTINEPTEVMASLVQVTELTCNDPAEIRLTASGGNGNYEYSSDNINFTPMGGNSITLPVSAGVYQFYVRDTNGCEAEISNQVSIDPVPPLTLNIDDSAAIINCMGEASATIMAQATGGLGNYNYELFSDAALTNLLAGPQTSGTFNGLPAGSYYVRVTSEDCVEVSPVITIVDPVPLQVDNQDFTNVTCSGMNDGSITVEVSGGTGEILYAISPNLDQFDTENTFTDLAPGIYDVIAQDVNGCFMTFQFEITQPEPIQAEAVNIMNEVCYNSADGSFELQITGGTAPYETALNSNANADFVQDQFLFQNLTAGTHVVFVRDAQGCETNVFVEIEPGVNLAATVTPMYECTGNIPDNYLQIVFEDETVSADVLYALDSTDPADMQLTADYTNITPGDHYITIAHANGCMITYDFTIEGYEPLTLLLENNNINQITAVAEGGVEDYTFYFNDINNGTDNTFYINRTDTYVVTVIDQNGCEATAEIYMEFIDIEFPNFFTPDGDGLNDTWIPNHIEGFPEVLIKVYDRYGRVVEEMTRDTQGWDGDYDGKPLPTGDYWYVVKLNGELDNREFVGHFTLYRQ